MKKIGVLAIIFVLALCVCMLESCVFVYNTDGLLDDITSYPSSPAESSSNNDVDDSDNDEFIENGCETSDLPDREYYDIIVSFQIKDANGMTLINAENYNYKSYAEPTILNIIDQYLAVVADYTCKIDDFGTLVQIGGIKANKVNGDFWGFVYGQIDMPKEDVISNLSDAKMSTTLVEDGGMFTVMLILGEEYYGN